MEVQSQVSSLLSNKVRPEKTELRDERVLAGIRNYAEVGEVGEVEKSEDDDILSEHKIIPEASQQPDNIKDDYNEMVEAFEKDFLNAKVEDDLYNMDNIGNGKVVSSPAKVKEEKEPEEVNEVKEVKEMKEHDDYDELDEILEDLGGTFVFAKKEVDEGKEIITQYSQKVTI